MAITLSHQSALDVIRAIRAEGNNLRDMETVKLVNPSAWVGKRLNKRNFEPDVWQWQQPSDDYPLHILVPNRRARTRGEGIQAHAAWSNMPAGSILWLDNNSSVVCPELLFLQMAECFSLPALVMLGLELCGHFSRSASNPLSGNAVDGIPSATCVANLSEYLVGFTNARGLTKARRALHFVSDHAVSIPEAVLATMYALPPTESGYGLGPVLLNERVRVDDSGLWSRRKNRFPDLMLCFAPVGINYDGSKHFDINELMIAAEALANADEGTQDEAREALKKKLVDARAKVLDDNMRNRQLAAQGKIIFSATKEDLADGEHLDALTEQILCCADQVFGADVSAYRRTLENTSCKRDRAELLESLLTYRYLGKSSYGKI